LNVLVETVCAVSNTVGLEGAGHEPIVGASARALARIPFIPITSSPACPPISSAETAALVSNGAPTDPVREEKVLAKIELDIVVTVKPLGAARVPAHGMASGVAMFMSVIYHCSVLTARLVGLPTDFVVLVAELHFPLVLVPSTHFPGSVAVRFQRIPNVVDIAGAVAAGGLSDPRLDHVDALVITSILNSDCSGAVLV
jgi:hypothetical protein